MPLLVLAVLVGLTAFGVNGSSAAAIRDVLGSSIGDDPHLVAGKPLIVRGDEWSINTPLTILQVRTAMPRLQPLLGDGVDMALAYDVPVAGPSMFVRPQHWGYLALPLSQAFAFQWWLPPALLVLALWFLTVALMPGRNGLGLLIGAAAAFSPFLQWWHLSGSFLPAALAVLACAMFVRILGTSAKWWLALYCALLTWVLVSFGLLFYPPFQIPCALVAAAFCAGYLIFVAREPGWRHVRPRLYAVLGCAAVAATCMALFVFDHIAAVQAIAASAYPGHRVVDTGGYSLPRLLSGFLDGRLTELGAAESIDVNQSEASSPLLAGLFVVPVLAWLQVTALRRSERLDPVVPLLVAVLIVFLVHLFVPQADLIARMTLLDRVPGNRLLLGLGMLSDVLLVVAAWQVSRSAKLPRGVLICTFGVPFVVLSAIALSLHVGDAALVGSLPVAWLLAALIGAAVALSVSPRPELGAATLLGVSLLVAGTVNPVSTGVSTVDELPIGAAVARVDRSEPGGWIMQLSQRAQGLLVEQSIHTYSVVYNYPLIELFRELDPRGEHLESYNRSGYADFVIGRGPARFPGHALDGFRILVDGCDPFVQARIRHIVSDQPLDAGCIRLRESLVSGDKRYHIYDITPGGAAARPSQR